MLLASKLPMGFYRSYALHFLLLTLVLLMLVPVIGVKANGSRRWLGIAGLTLQPSELAKLAVILSFAWLICRFRGRMRTVRYGLLPFAGILAVIVGLLVLEPHFSASVIILAVGAVMLFLGGVSFAWFAGAFAAAGAGLAVLLTFFPYASTRISTWRDPFSSSSDDGYQIVQSLYTIGSGGLSGLGLGGSRQKFLYLPEEHNDFIFSVHLRGAGLHRCGGHTYPFCDAHSARLLDSAPLPRQVQLSCLRRDNDAAGDTGFPERCGRDEPCAVYGDIAAAVQLRRDGAAHTAR